MKARGAATECLGTVHDATCVVTLRPKHPAFPHIRGAARSRPLGPRSSSMNGAELPLRCCVRGGLGPRAAPLRSGTVLWPPATRGPRATGRTAEYRQGPAPALGPMCRRGLSWNEPARTGSVPPVARRRASGQSTWRRPAVLTTMPKEQFDVLRSCPPPEVGRPGQRGTIPAPQAHQCCSLTRWPRRCSSVVEQLIRNQQVVSSNLTVGSKRPKGA